MPSKKKTTTDRDKGAIRIRRKLDIAKGSTVDVGFWGVKKHTDGTATIPYIASIHEFGSLDGKIPERSFLRSTYDDNDGYKKELADAGKSIVDGKSVKDALVLFGEKARGDVVVKITKGDPKWPQLAASTVKQRKHGGTQPLFDTGTLAKSVSTRVFIKGAKVADNDGGA